MSISNLAITAGLIIAGYLAGSVPFSYLVARARGVDLRTVGSGNIGGANVWRSSGFGPFVVAAGLDMLKGLLPTLAALRLLPGQFSSIVLVGIAAIVGHTLPLFLNFKGGKAVATSGGVLLALFPPLVLVGVAAWVIAFLITRISSVGSLSAAGAEIVAGTLLYAAGRLPLAYTVFVWASALLVVYLHRANIQRLLAGTENKFSRLF